MKNFSDHPKPEGGCIPMANGHITVGACCEWEEIKEVAKARGLRIQSNEVLDDLICEALSVSGRASVFAITENASMANAFDRLQGRGRIVFEKGKGEFPWCYYSVPEHSTTTMSGEAPDA